MSGPRPSLSHGSRNALIVGAVVLLHAGLLWSLQAGLLRRAAEVVVPVELLDANSSPPRVEPPAAAPVAPPPPRPEPRHHTTATVRPTPPPPPRPAATREAPAAPTPDTVTATSQPQPPAPPIAAPVAVAPPPAPAAPPSPAAGKVEQPISDADYLHNPPPAYPRASERLGEKGLVIVHVLIATDGRARKAQIAKSSGFPRLDDASIAAVLGWRYVPGKRGGVPEEMWFDVPIRWSGPGKEEKG